MGDAFTKNLEPLLSVTAIDWAIVEDVVELDRVDDVVDGLAASRAPARTPGRLPQLAAAETVSRQVTAAIALRAARKAREPGVIDRRHRGGRSAEALVPPWPTLLVVL
jgi:hypothetical protein